jgi:hypothetical protein
LWTNGYYGLAGNLINVLVADEIKHLQPTRLLNSQSNWKRKNSQSYIELLENYWKIAKAINLQVKNKDGFFNYKKETVWFLLTISYHLQS